MHDAPAVQVAHALGHLRQAAQERYLHTHTGAGQCIMSAHPSEHAGAHPKSTVHNGLRSARHTRTKA